MTQQFQVYQQATGDLMTADGVVIDLKNGAVFRVGSDAFSGGGNATGTGADHLKDSIEAPQGVGGSFMGGSGRNIIVSGMPGTLSGASSPDGIYWPERPGFFSMGGWTIEVLGSSSATLSDGVDIVAELTTGGLAPVGDYDSTTYGQDTYNGGTPFTLTIAGEGGTAADIPAAIVTISSGTAQGGTYTATDTANYVSDVDTDWTLYIAADGAAELRQLGTAVALRPVGLGYDPAGLYESTEAAAALNPIYDDETATDIDTPWTATVQVQREISRAGFVFITITEAAGAITAVSDPIFATALPTPAAGEYHVTLAQADGLGGLEQLATGPILWRPAESGGGGAAFVEIDEADYEALGTPDPDTYYDVILP